MFLYATESYAIDTALQNKISASQMQYLWIILNISKDHVTNEHVHKLTNNQPLMKRVTKSQLSLLGYSIQWREDDFIRQYCLYVSAHGHWRRGQQRTTYVQHIAKAISGDNLMEENRLHDAASDRVAWRNAVTNKLQFTIEEKITLELVLTWWWGEADI